MSSRECSLTKRRAIARRFAGHLGEHPEVTAVLAFGSVATGYVDDASDVDLLVVCEPDPPGLAVRRKALPKLGDGWTFGIAGDPLFPAIDEGRAAEGVPVTLHYQQVQAIDRILGDVLLRGAISTPEVPFRPYTLAGLLGRAWVLEDKRGTVALWQARTSVYPPALRQNLLAHFVPFLREHTAELTANARRHLGPVVLIFHLNWAVDAMVSILYALNGLYDPADRRAERTIWPHFRVAPEGFLERLTDVLEGPFDDQTAVQKAERFGELVGEVLALSE